MREQQFSPRGRFPAQHLKSRESVSQKHLISLHAEQVALGPLGGCRDESFSLEGARDERHLPNRSRGHLDCKWAFAQFLSRARIFIRDGIVMRAERRGANTISPRLVVAKDVSAIALSSIQWNAQANILRWLSLSSIFMWVTDGEQPLLNINRQTRGGRPRASFVFQLILVGVCLREKIRSLPESQRIKHNESAREADNAAWLQK